MKLSIVIPAYNEEQYIGSCLSSLERELARVNHDVEVIVVNNASVDRTGEVASSFSFARVVDEPKKGLVRARHAGYLVSSGELIANVDADTVFPEGWIDKVHTAFVKDDALVALSGPYIYHDLSGMTNAGVWVFYFIGYLGHSFNRFVLRRGGTMLQGGNFILRKTALEKAGGYNLDFDFYGEDTEVARLVSPHGKVHFTFALPMYTSGRRLAKEGVITMGARYALNHLWTIFFRKPFTKKYIDVRSVSEKNSL
jgi:glycosyltransferase involved in cell wall biosynthesis